MISGRRDFLAGGLALAASPQDRDTPPRWGVVHVRACFEKDYERMKEVEAEVAALRDRFSREAEELRKRIALLTEKMEQVKNAPDTYVETVRLRGHAEVDLKLLQEVARRRLRDLALDHEGRITAEIRRVTALVARDRKLQMVLRADEPAPPAEDPEGAPRPPTASREMLYHDPALDLTPAVLERLNAEWKKAWACPTCKRKVTEPACRDCKRP